MEAFLARVLAAAEARCARLRIAAGDDPWVEELLRLLDGVLAVPIRARSAAEALALAMDQPVGCVIVDSELSDSRGVDLLGRLAERASGPLAAVLHAPIALNPADESAVAALAPRVRLRRAAALDRVLDEVVRLLGLPVRSLPPELRERIVRLHRPEVVLAGKSVLVVDDDARSVFAMTSVLERHGVRVRACGSGPEALRILATTDAVDAVLMDVMMPGMDGNDTIRAVRRDARFASLPILALTARAMPGDREACLAAGASGYAAKPVDVEQLLAALCLWLHR
jgi:CheY-like chemotaxis protein